MNTQYTKLGHAMPVRLDGCRAVPQAAACTSENRAQSLHSGLRGPTNLAKTAAVQA